MMIIESSFSVVGATKILFFIRPRSVPSVQFHRWPPGPPLGKTAYVVFQVLLVVFAWLGMGGMNCRSLGLTLALVLLLYNLKAPAIFLFPHSRLRPKPQPLDGVVTFFMLLPFLHFLPSIKQFCGKKYRNPLRALSSP